ncbi:MAG: acetamidase/formamidase family protein [Tissierellia bacterium]|nr:acetamidase/formamidase family protein [Tissierellia bacterium]
MKEFFTDKVINTFKPEMEEAYRIESGERIIVHTRDCYSGALTKPTDSYENMDRSGFNTATGPFYVEGAMPGDVLKVQIIDLEVANQGVAVVVPNEGTVGYRVEKKKFNLIPVRNGMVEYGDFTFPADPMIGIIGVATKDEVIPTNIPGDHGANMDTKDIKKGSTVYLPVFQKGGMLALGDVHGKMGDGESSCSGLEIPGKATLQIDVIKNGDLKMPLVETENEFMVIATASTIEDANAKGTEEMVRLFQKISHMPWEDLYMMMGMVMDLRISQVVNPMMTIRTVVPRNLLNGRMLFGNR